MIVGCNHLCLSHHEHNEEGFDGLHYEYYHVILGWQPHQSMETLCCYEG